jgi:hypothetical protein
LNRETYKAIVKSRFMAGSLLEEVNAMEEDVNNSDDEDEKKSKRK